MLFHTSSVIAAALFVGQASAFYSVCSIGQYIDNQGHCQTCPDGSVNPSLVWGSSATTCTPCPAGKQSNLLHSDCNTCGSGKFSTSGSQCQSCPAGQTNNDAHTGCDKCTPGTYNGSVGGTCSKCTLGTFNNVYGAKECCSCCAGWYSTSLTGSTSCTKCDASKPYSNVGTSSSVLCTSNYNLGGKHNPTTSCGMVADNVCPNTTGDGPMGTAITRKRHNVQCTNGKTACPRYSGRGGFDCVDTENDPESCGGCLTLDGQGEGKDCTAMKGVSIARCVNKTCVVDSCRKGWVKSVDGTSCVVASRGTVGSPESGGLNVQDTTSKKRRASSKRALRSNIY